MITIQNKAECCGCTACYNICPKEAIQMKPDFEGFLYPFVNTERCVECGLCDAVCPVQNPVSCDELERKSYVIRTKDSHVLDHSTWGIYYSVRAVGHKTKWSDLWSSFQQ